MKWKTIEIFKFKCPCTKEIIEESKMLSDEIIRLYFLSIPVPCHIQKNGYRMCTKDESFRIPFEEENLDDKPEESK